MTSTDKTTTDNNQSPQLLDGQSPTTDVAEQTPVSSTPQEQDVPSSQTAPIRLPTSPSPKTKETKEKNSKDPLTLALAAIDKRWGKGALFQGGDNNTIPDIEFINSGSIGLDTILGGGYGRGRLVEIYGPSASGKTTCSLHAIAECQKLGLPCAFVDAEHALDKKYSRALGVNFDELYIAQPDFGEQALDIVDTLVRTGEMGLIVVDSVAALTPKVELDGEMNEQQVGLQARLMSKAMRKLSGITYKSNTTVIFINQTRANIGYGTVGSTTTGGNALKFYSSQRLEIRRIGAVKDGDNIVGNKTKIKVAKNKIAAPFREIELCLTYGRGLNKSVEILVLGTKYDLIDKSGAWFTFPNKERAQGQNNGAKYLDENPKVAEELEVAIKEKIAENGGRL